MTEEQPWKPQGETIKERAIETSRKLLDLGLTQAGVVERVVFQEIQRVLTPRLEQRIQNESEESVQTQLVRLRTWIDAVLGEEDASHEPSHESAKKAHKAVKSAQKRAKAKRRVRPAAAKILAVKPVAVLTSFDTNNHNRKSSVAPKPLR
ncbi:MAG: hypothetical protein A2201_00730 [Alicyclobacillus sp. RIFOXYA1_FULL_53_8]|nr:MAG: hypothetical protein A2201_00730 [Alicyclobacillus sp. RIFOXYA1_FULL_53_8]